VLASNVVISIEQTFVAHRFITEILYYIRSPRHMEKATRDALMDTRQADWSRHQITGHCRKMTMTMSMM